MADTSKNITNKVGLPPGSLIHIGDVHESSTRISVIHYSESMVEERIITSLDELTPFKTPDTVTWITVEGLRDTAAIEKLGELFGIHQLVLEDILNTHQRPKFEEYDNYLYIVLKSIISEDAEDLSLVYEQISLLLFNNVVITFKEKQDELLHPVTQRIRTSKGRFRSQGADYLTYTILDTIVDHGFLLIDSLDDSINAIEDLLLTSEPTREILHSIQSLRRELVDIRRYISPMRELMAALLRSESDLIQEKTRIYLRDVSDHTIRIIESIEAYRDILAGLLEIYVSSISNKMNEIMKVLTIFASIFIPLTFIAGIYGMNFEHMPELKWHWAYPALWGVFIVIPVILIVYFKKKKWF